MNTIRFSSQAWVIPLFCEHACDRSVIPCRDDCLNVNTAEMATVSLVDFDLTSGNGVNGLLLNLDDIVIRDLEYAIRVDKPLIEGVSIQIKKTRGTTLRELIWLITRIYQRIYEIEADTASEISLPIEKECTSCDSAPLTVHEIVGDGDTCSICYNPLDGRVAKTACSHSFHSECINRWAQVSSTPTCPMCRSSIRRCEACDDTQSILRYETFTELPLELADSLTGGVRNTTDGMYGIHTYFRSQLFLRGLQYDRTTRTVYATITA